MTIELEQSLAGESKIESAVRDMLLAIGENPDREGLLETPARVARMYAELFSGLGEDPAVHLKKQFTTKSNSMVIVSHIPFYSACEHHLVPFHGVAHIGYLPGRAEVLPPTGYELKIGPSGEQFWEDELEKLHAIPKEYRIAGLSKFARVVHGFARRPQVQEVLCAQVADCIQEALEPKGVIVVMRAQHLCMSMRGVKVEGAWTTTSAVRGMFDTNKDDVKGEFFRLLHDA